MKSRRLIAAFLLALAGCAAPLYETDDAVYRQYKYWESADKDWEEYDYFKILIYRTHYGDNKTAMRLIPHRNGLPSTESGYIQAAQKAAFNAMSQACSPKMPSVDPAAAPAKGRKIDRFFYQYGDGSVGVTFGCPAVKNKGLDLMAEQQKWSLARREWDEIKGHKAFVDTLPPSANGIRQIRIRLFGGTRGDNARLARRIITDTCPNTNFRILSSRAGLDIVPSGRAPDIVSDENVGIYDFICSP